MKREPLSGCTYSFKKGYEKRYSSVGAGKSRLHISTKIIIEFILQI